MAFKVLLIDDEPGALEGLQLFIDWRELGFEICGSCSNGLEGLRLMEELSPDLVVTDVQMPLMNGLDMIGEWQKRQEKPVRFAILSGYSEFEYARKAMHYGINHYLLKPVIAEEAESQLKEIYRELVREQDKRALSRQISEEETAAMLKDALTGRTMGTADQERLNLLSASREAWSVCLVQAEPSGIAVLRQAAASLRDPEWSLFPVELEPDGMAIVCGRPPGSPEAAVCPAIERWLSELAGHRLFAAAGCELPSLLHIERSYRTAKEAAAYSFYSPEYGRMMRYGDIREQALSRNYDHIKRMDELLKAFDLLDAGSFRLAVQAATASFREMLVAPEIVKKFVIHMMHALFDMVRDGSSLSADSVWNKESIPEITRSVLNLDDLMARLEALGTAGIERLQAEQQLKSKGIVRDINEYIAQHFREPLTIKKLADRFYLNPVYLGQLLIKKNGVSFYETLHALRIDEAVRLLEKKEKNNSEIAEAVGYASYGQFLRQFEKRIGMPPGEYKSRC